MALPNFDLTGKVCFITGTTSGLLLLLASEAGDFMTGAGVRIDDGQALGF